MLDLGLHIYTEKHCMHLGMARWCTLSSSGRHHSYLNLQTFEHICVQHSQHLFFWLHRFFKSYFLDACLELTADPVPNVRLHLAALLPALKQSIRSPPTSILLAVAQLQAHNLYLPISIQDSTELHTPIQETTAQTMMVWL